MRLIFRLFFGLVALSVSNAITAQEFTSVQTDLLGIEKTSSSAWADYDGDGWLDLAVALTAGEIQLYRNDHGNFVNVGSRARLLTKSGRRDEVPVAIAWGDYDGDGDIDLYVGTMIPPGAVQTHLSRNYLYRNDGADGFVEVAQQARVDLAGGDTRQVSWIDYDNDGDLDLFVALRSGYNRLFRHDGVDFHDVSFEVGLFDPRRTVGACWFDMDKDGDLDLFLANQNGDRDALYRNDGDKFTDVAAEKKMDQPLRKLSEGSVGCSVGDFDNDGDLDLFVTAYGANVLYRNDGAGQFEEVSQRLGIGGDNHAVGASWGDYDNDGLLDLYIAGYLPRQNVPHDYLFQNKGDRFINLLKEESVLDVADHGVQWADYDRDGDLDLAVTSSFNGKPGNWLLRNELPKVPGRGSLQILVLDADGNYTRAGAEVRLYDIHDKLIGTRIVPTGDGYNSQSAMPVHFGLPQSASVTVEVTFLTREGRSIQRLTRIDTRNPPGKIVVINQKQLPERQPAGSR